MTCHASATSRSVSAAGPSWHRVARACLDQLEPVPSGASLGVAYFGEQLAPMADAIVAALRERTGVGLWLAASGAAALGGPGGARDNGLSVLVTGLPDGAFALAPGLRPPLDGAGLVLAHAAFDEMEPAGFLAELAAAGSPARSVGGLIAAPRAPVHLAGGAGVAGSAAALALAADVPAVAGLATACTALGPPHRVTSALGPLVLALDGRPALEVMGEEMGELFRRGGERAVRGLWLGEVGPDGGSLRARRAGIADAASGSLRVAGGRIEGRVQLLRPDPAAALARLGELARELRGQLGGRPAGAGLYLASRHRGRSLFGPGVDELDLLRRELGGAPLIGLVTDAELFAGELHEGAGVLVLIGGGEGARPATGRRP